MLLTKEMYVNYLKKLGYIAILPDHCVERINEIIKNGEVNFSIYVTSGDREGEYFGEKICWFASNGWINISKRVNVGTSEIVELNIREFILDSIITS